MRQNNGNLQHQSEIRPDIEEGSEAVAALGGVGGLEAARVRATGAEATHLVTATDRDASLIFWSKLTTSIRLRLQKLTATPKRSSSHLLCSSDLGRV